MLVIIVIIIIFFFFCENVCDKRLTLIVMCKLNKCQRRMAFAAFYILHIEAEHSTRSNANTHFHKGFFLGSLYNVSKTFSCSFVRKVKAQQENN